MRGLLTKDLILLGLRKRTYVIFLGVMIVMGMSTEPSFLVGYMGFLSVIVAIGTLSYDDADNGMTFLMTLPISRRTYADSKYVLSAAFCSVSCVVTMIFIAVLCLIRHIPMTGSDLVVDITTFLVMADLLMNLMIPLQLKYGAERSRIVMLIIVGGFAAVGLVIVKAFLKKAQIEAMLQSVEQTSDLLIVGIMAGICILLTILSVQVSRRIMEKKSY